MSESPGSDQTKDEQEVPLEDIDRLLNEEDPEFTRQLEEVKAAEFDRSVEIEATVIDDNLTDEKVDAESAKIPYLKRLRAQIRFRLISWRVALRGRMIAFLFGTIVFLKTRPKEFFFYSLAFTKTLIKSSVYPIRAFSEATRLQKIAVLILLGLSGGVVWVLRANFKGIWLPQLNQPILQSFADHADSVTTFNPAQPGESFYAAFPQQRHEFLFPKIKINLQASAGHPNPMGAFELFVQVDSHDTALELNARQVEFFDLIQRVMEGETYDSLVTERGKVRMKRDIEAALNKRLTQGWVKDISFKTFILKP